MIVYHCLILDSAEFHILTAIASLSVGRKEQGYELQSKFEGQFPVACTGHQNCWFFLCLPYFERLWFLKSVPIIYCLWAQPTSVLNSLMVPDFSLHLFFSPESTQKP